MKRMKRMKEEKEEEKKKQSLFVCFYPPTMT